MPPTSEFVRSTLAQARRRIPTGLAGGVFWLALWFGMLWLLRLPPIPGRSLLGWMQLLVGAALLSLAVPLAVRIVRRHLLWRLRNKLVITYLLIGLAPFLLFLTLVALSAYVAAGQFSIHLADNRLRQQLDQIGEENSARASGLAHVLTVRNQLAAASPSANRGPHPPPVSRFRPQPAPRPNGPSSSSTAQQPAPTAVATPPLNASQSAAQAAAAALGETPPNPLIARLHRHTTAYVNGAPLSTLFSELAPLGAQPSAGPSGPLGLPAWAADLRGLQFRGLVLDGQDLFLVAIDQRQVESSGLLTVITSLPVNKDLMDVVADGLGSVNIWSIATGSLRSAAEQAALSAAHSAQPGSDRTSIFGGRDPVAANACDFGIPFDSTMAIRDWGTGDPDNVPIAVHSRPSVLYRQLFGSSISGFVTSSIRFGFVAVCLLFALIEAVALWAALRLSRQITTSVEELYSATQRVDRGDLTHRIPARAAREDQLGELSRSFNRMTGSLERLIVEQQEKERLQNEISIAQEVQANLFPHHVESLPSLELHGVCRPARSVSGDYYDFFVFRGPESGDNSPGPETGVGIALGDISGKGISAALLMATLHSAVRAYRLVSEDLAVTDANSPGAGAPLSQRLSTPSAAAHSTMASALLMAENEAALCDGSLFATPARILALVNRHLYLSTQPEKYATLFLAHYDAVTAELIYSNAGHLPPILLGRDGSVQRLESGGTVVGLFPGPQYEDGRVHLRSGDILIGYSDGITEPENDFGEFGETRLIETVARYRDQPLSFISAQVMLALDAWIGAAEQPDDVTLVLARQA